MMLHFTNVFYLLFFMFLDVDNYFHDLSHNVTDSYTCSNTHKCYATQQGDYQLFVLYRTTIPTYAMR